MDGFDHRPLLEPIGHVPRAELKQAYYRQHEESAIVACLNVNSLRENRGGSNREAEACAARDETNPAPPGNEDSGATSLLQQALTRENMAAAWKRVKLTERAPESIASPSSKLRNTSKPTGAASQGAMR